MATTQAEIEARISSISEQLAEAITQVTTDGTTTMVDLKELRRERAYLQRQLANMKVPTSVTVNLSSG